MTTGTSQIEERVTKLEHSLNRARLTASLLGLALLAMLAVAFARANQVVDEIRTHRLVVIDDECLAGQSTLSEGGGEPPPWAAAVAPRVAFQTRGSCVWPGA